EVTSSVRLRPGKVQGLASFGGERRPAGSWVARTSVPTWPRTTKLLDTAQHWHLEPRTGRGHRTGCAVAAAHCLSEGPSGKSDERTKGQGSKRRAGGGRQGEAANSGEVPGASRR